jgi:hypothetical protein
MIALKDYREHSIAHIWCVEDMQEERPDLTDAQAKALDECDASIGVNWDVLILWADNLFPQK